MSSKLLTVAFVLTLLPAVLGLDASRAEDAAPSPPAAAQSAPPPAPKLVDPTPSR